MTSTCRGRKCHGDRGFTLLELIVAIVILGVITLPLGNFVLSYLHNAADTQSRLNASHDLQIATAYFAQDVASSGVRSGNSLGGFLWVAPFSGVPSACGVGGSNQRILLLASDNFDGVTPGSFRSTTTPSVDYVAYVVEGASAPYELHRIRCGSHPSDATLAHNLLAVPTAPLCDTVICGSGVSPDIVTLGVSFKDTSSPTGSYAATLVGDRRQSS